MLVKVIILAITIAAIQSHTLLTLPPLPYAYNALEPVLSEKIMKLHHDGHFDGYIKKTNEVLKTIHEDSKATPEVKELINKPIETILTELKNLPDHYHIALRHFGGGYLNHKMFFEMLRAPSTGNTENKPTGDLLSAIERDFGTFDKFREMFTTASNNFFGSGWVWLYVDSKTKQLVLNFTANQDNPIMFDKDHAILLGIDLWEHAYYPLYENRRHEYIEKFWKIVNWTYVTELYNQSKKQHKDL